MEGFLTKKTLVVNFKAPVHVGCGETISRFDYYFNIAKHSVVRVNTLNFILSLPELERKVLENINYEKPSEVFRVFDELYARNQEILKENAIWITGISSGFVRKYQSLSQDSQREIKVQTRTGLSMKPYLPGSSLKGAISTAILFHLKNNRLNNQDFETFAKYAIIGKSPNTALGRLIKVSDSLPMENEKLKTYVFYVKKIYRANTSRRGNLYQFVDCLFNCKSYHDVTFLKLPDSGLREEEKVNTFGLEIKSDFIVEACNKYYGEVVLPEIIRKIGERNLSDEFLSLHDMVRDGRLSRNQFLLQVGWGVGVEGITLLKNRSNTAWVVEGTDGKAIPMGWCLAEFK